MKIAIFSAKSYDREFFNEANTVHGYSLDFFESHLNHETCQLAHGYKVICVFTNDNLSRETLTKLSKGGTSLVALRCAGYNNIDLKAAHELGIRVVRVPAYSPYAVAEHALALMLTLNRKTHRAYNRVREGNFSLEGLMGFDLHGKCVGIIGTGKIGAVMAKLLTGLGCEVLAYGTQVNSNCTAIGVTYVDLLTLCRRSDIITLHCPLTPDTYHLINAERLEQMKPGVMLINTSRGGIIDTQEVIEALKSGKIGYLGLDVYEEEGDLFFEDLSNQVIKDDIFSRLLTFPNVLITGHQGFLTREALTNIANITLSNVATILDQQPSENELLFV